MLSSRARLLTRLGSTVLAAVAVSHYRAAPAAQVPSVASEVAQTITAGECSTARVSTSIAPGLVGEPVSAVRLAEPRWVAATETTAAYCVVDGAMLPVDTAPTARPINFRVVLPAAWSGRAAQIGGGGMNGVIPNLTGGGAAAVFARGFVTFGSDSGHALKEPPDWTMNDEAIRNLGYMQMKKTRDAAMVIVDRVYDTRPRFTYYIGTSQGGREALMVAQRYPADYDGIAANVPIVGFSSLMLAPELIRIHEKPLANWVTPAKVNGIRGQFVRQCDGLDGRVDGVINRYMACRARFDETAPDPWAAKRCPGGIDSDPADASASACLTDGQIATLRLTYGRYRYTTPLAGDASFGMWVPNTDPSGSGLILPTRVRGQEGAAPDAPMHAHLGVLGVTGFLMRDPARANPLDYVEGGPLNARRQELARWLDATDPDLSAFERRGGKLIVAIGTNDTLASPGEQLDYYQALVDRMGRPALDGFARLYVLPQAGHGLTGTNYGMDGEGRTIPSAPLPTAFDRVSLLIDWVERDIPPGRSIVGTAGERSAPICSYPEYPRYVSGPPEVAASYRCQE